MQHVHKTERKAKTNKVFQCKGLHAFFFFFFDR